MPLIQTDSQHYSDIADAIRDMSGNEETFYPSEMAAGVRSIPQTIAIQPIIYSLEEREVGVWTDGKQLYEKTVHINSLPSNTFTEIPYPHNITNIDTICGYGGVVRWTDGGVANISARIYLPGSASSKYLRTEDSSWQFQCTKDNILIAVSANRTALSADVTIRYTKTTDTPGSGTWTPSGVPAHHYSTEEQVIGTWVDGKPLYEKTIYCASLPNNSSLQISTGYTELNIVDLFGIASAIFVENGKQFIKLPNVSTNLQYSISLHSDYNGEYVIIRTGSDRSKYSAYITIQYTKTTD